jgi:hypothetical protein
MKKILAILLMMPVIAVSDVRIIEVNQEVKTVPIPAYCVTLQQLSDILDEHDELPLIRGKSVRETDKEPSVNPLVLFMNGKTGSWTIAEKIPSNLYCIIAVGAEMQMVPGDVIDNMMKERDRRRS